MLHVTHLKLVHSAVTWAWGEDWGVPQDRGEQVRSGPYLGT